MIINSIAITFIKNIAFKQFLKLGVTVFIISLNLMVQKTGKPI